MSESDSAGQVETLPTMGSRLVEVTLKDVVETDVAEETEEAMAAEAAVAQAAGMVVTRARKSF